MECERKKDKSVCTDKDGIINPHSTSKVCQLF